MPLSDNLQHSLRVASRAVAGGFLISPGRSPHIIAAAAGCLPGTSLGHGPGRGLGLARLHSRPPPQPPSKFPVPSLRPSNPGRRHGSQKLRRAAGRGRLSWGSRDSEEGPGEGGGGSFAAQQTIRCEGGRPGGGGHPESTGASGRLSRAPARAIHASPLQDIFNHSPRRAGRRLTATSWHRQQGKFGRGVG